MKLYHGTNGTWLDHILKVGLKPRGNRSQGNWHHTVNSNPKCVYVTDSYAPYFAFNATRGKEPICAVIEIDSDRLDPANLFPDEDFLEQISRNEENAIPGDMKTRTLHYRKHQFDYDWPCINQKDGSETTWWEASLRFLGTASYRGVIPSSAITRAVRWPHKPNIRLQFIWDPSISLMNQQVCGDRYRLLTDKLFCGEFTTPEEAETRHETDPLANFLPIIEGWEIIRQDAIPA